MADPETTDEKALVEAAQADSALFLELYERHLHRVWAYVIRRTGNRAEAENVTSEVFRRALESLRDYQWRGIAFAAWLLRIASNLMAQRWAKAGRESRNEAPGTADPDWDLERRALLFQLVDRLPEAQRRVIELRYGEERSLVETAAALGRTEGAIKQLQRRALKRLRGEMEARHGSPARGLGRSRAFRLPEPGVPGRLARRVGKEDLHDGDRSAGRVQYGDAIRDRG